MAGAGTSSESSGLSSPAYAAERSHAGPTIDSVAVSTSAVTVSAALQGECSARPTRHRRRVDFFGIRLAKRCSIFASTARRRCLGPPSCAPALVARSPVARSSDASQRSLLLVRSSGVRPCALTGGLVTAQAALSDTVGHRLITESTVEESGRASPRRRQPRAQS